MDISKTLEQTLNERPIKLSDIPDLELSENSQAFDELQKLCERKAAYRLGVDKFIGRKFIWNLILDSIKLERPLNNISVDGFLISQNIVSNMLIAMKDQGLIEKEENNYHIVLDKVLSKEIIVEFCWCRADQIKIENILSHFHFATQKTAYGATGPSAAFIHCQNILNALYKEKLLNKSLVDDSFCWNDI